MEKEIEIWRLFTSLDLKKQALLFLSLTGQVRQTIVGLDINQGVDEGVEILIKELEKLYLKDSQYSAYEIFEPFEKPFRLKAISISNYIIVFEHLYKKVKSFNIALPDGVLAYKFLNIVNISE